MHNKIEDVIEQLGITRNCKGFYYLAYSLSLIVENPQRLLMVTKLIYPDVARHFKTTPANVERDLRTVSKIAWKQNPAFLKKIAKHDLQSAPTVGRLLSFLGAYLKRGGKPDSCAAAERIEDRAC